VDCSNRSKRRIQTRFETSYFQDDEYGQGGSGSTEEAERIKVFYGSATPPLDVTFGGGFIPYVSFDLLGVDPVQSISLKDITIGGGEFGLVSSLDETASGFSTSVPSYNVYVNADTSTVQLLTFIDDSLSCTAEQIASVLLGNFHSPRCAYIFERHSVEGAKSAEFLSENVYVLPRILVR